MRPGSKEEEAAVVKPTVQGLATLGEELQKSTTLVDERRLSGTSDKSTEAPTSFSSNGSNPRPLTPDSLDDSPTALQDTATKPYLDPSAAVTAEKQSAPPALTHAPSTMSKPPLGEPQAKKNKPRMSTKGYTPKKGNVEQTWEKFNIHWRAASAGALAGAGIGYFASQLVIASIISPPLVILACVLLTVLFIVGGACLGAQMGAWMAQKPKAAAVAKSQDVEAAHCTSETSFGATK